MDTLIATLRWIHIAAGTLALGLAPAAMLTVKGSRAHRRWGKIYFWAMAVVGSTAVALGLWRPQIFLALLAVFSFTFLPPAVRWLWPTAIGVPMITLWITYYKVRFRQSARSRVEATRAGRV